MNRRPLVADNDSARLVYSLGEQLRAIAADLDETDRRDYHLLREVAAAIKGVCDTMRKKIDAAETLHHDERHHDER